MFSAFNDCFTENISRRWPRPFIPSCFTVTYSNGSSVMCKMTFHRWSRNGNEAKVIDDFILAIQPPFSGLINYFVKLRSINLKLINLEKRLESKHSYLLKSFDYIILSSCLDDSHRCNSSESSRHLIRSNRDNFRTLTGRKHESDLDLTSIPT